LAARLTAQEIEALRTLRTKALDAISLLETVRRFDEYLTFSAAFYHRKFSELKDKIDASLTNVRTVELSN
jgi:hypothetical protein